MARGISVHVGLNKVDPSGYGGWSGILAGCINDATAMQGITSALQYDTTLLTDEQATADAVKQAISNAAGALTGDDIFVLTFSGHGGQQADTDGEESDGQDETICCYDRMLVDDELYELWSGFPAGARIFMLADSCHSGTVARMLVYKAIANVAAQPVATPAASQLRVIPPEILPHAIAKVRAVRGAPRALRAEVAASVLLISGCADNQLSSDGTNNGLFTEKLLEVWQSGAFSGDYDAFRQAIVMKMPPTQTPNLFMTGAPNDPFEHQKPFTIDAVSNGSSGTAALGTPTVSAAAQLSSGGPAPIFTADTAGYPYWVIEIATSADLLDSNNAAQRDAACYYGSWNDAAVPARLSGSTFALPDGAWASLRHASTLAYRITTTTSADPASWDSWSESAIAELTVVSSDDTSTGDENPAPTQSAKPSIAGPDSWPRGDEPPTFTVDRAGNPYYEVELTTDPALFEHPDQGSAATFYASWNDDSVPTRLSDDQYVPTAAAWSSLQAGDTISYRVITTSSAGRDTWNNAEESTPASEGASAPSLAVTGARARRARAKTASR